MALLTALDTRLLPSVESSGIQGRKGPTGGQLVEDKMQKALSQAREIDPAPGPTSELPSQLPGLRVPLGLEAFLSGELYLFPRAAVGNYHKPGGLWQQKSFAHSAGAQNSPITGSAGSVLPEAGRQSLSRSLSQPRGAASDPWCQLACSRIPLVSASVIT